MQTLAYTIGHSRYLNITDRCTLRCRFCPKFRDGPRVHGIDLSLDRRPSVPSIIEAMGEIENIREVVFCGFGEPTLRLEPLLEIAHHVKSAGGRVRVNTDGLANLVHKRNVLPELADCVDSLSISMNAQNDALYRKHCRPALADSFPAMLNFVALAPHYIEQVTVTAIEGLAGVDIAACERLARRRGAQFRRRQLDIVG